MPPITRTGIRKVLLFCVLSVGVLPFSFSQDPGLTYSFLHYGINEGLPSSETYDVYQDPRTGVLWIATDRGLVRYDGYEFRTYTMDEGLTDNVIIRITPDQFGNLWLHTLNSRLCYLGPGYRIRHYPYNRQIMAQYDSIGVHDPKVVSLHLDENKCLHLYFQHAPGKISVDRYGRVSSTAFPSSRPNEVYLNFLPDQPVCYLSEKPEAFYSYAITDRALATIHTVNDTTFVLTDGPMIRIYNGNTLKDTIACPGPALYSDRLNDSLFWVSFRSGGVRFYDLNGVQRHQFLDHEIVSRVSTDHEGGIWFSTLSNGLFYLKSMRIRTFRSNPSDRLVSISALRDTLVLGYYSGAVFTLHTSTLEHRPYPTFPTNSPALVQADTANHTIYCSGRLQSGWSRSNGQDSRTFKYGTVKISDDLTDGSVFFGTYVGFLQRVGDTLIHRPAKNRISDVSLLQNTIILASSDGLYQHAGDSLLRISHPLLDARIEDIDRFRDGIICASLGGGLIYYGTDTIFAIKKQNGLLTNLSTEVFVENDSTIWLATTSGANKLVLDAHFNYTIQSYTTTDGLISNEVLDIDMTNDQIWIATKKGLNVINKDDRQNTDQPFLYLSIASVVVNGMPQTLSGHTLQLPHHANNVEVFFNAVSFGRNHLLTYRYRLSDTNEQWLTTKNRSVVFPALPAGSHTLEIQASTDNLTWSDSVTLGISISPPFWKTWWFNGIVIIAITGFFLLIFFYKLRQQQLKTNALEMEMKALRAQMNPHFVFNSLSSVQHFILTGNVDDSNRYLTKFSRLIRGVLENSKSEFVPLQQELDLLRLYVELEQLRVNGFKYEVRIDPAIDMQQLQIPPMIIQPFIENAIHHGLEPSDNPGELILGLTLSGSNLVCTVDDNGVGMNYTKGKQSHVIKGTNKSYGIEITRERIGALKKIHAMEIGLTIHHKLDADHLPAGTKVEIILPLINRNVYAGDHH